MNYLLNMDKNIKDAVKVFLGDPDKVIECVDYTSYSSYTFKENDLVAFIEYPESVDTNLNNSNVKTPFLLHLAILAVNGNDTMKQAPQMMKDYLEQHNDAIINSISINRLGRIYFDKEKSTWLSYIVGNIYWDR